MRKMFESLGEIHGLSWVLTIGLDLMWNVVDAGAVCSIGGILTIPYWSLVIFVICFVAVILVQRFVSKDEWEEATAKALALAVLAAVPFSILTFVGRSIYNSVQHLFEATQVGSMIIPWREFEKRAIASAKSLGMKATSNGNYEMANVIRFLVKHGMIAASDVAALRTIRRARNDSAHIGTPENIQQLIAEEEALLQKIMQRL